MQAPAGQPWLVCKKCGYDLRGLTDHRCPECGQAFDPRRMESDFFYQTKKWPIAGVVTKYFSLLFTAFIGCLFLAFGVRQAFAMFHPKAVSMYYYTNHGDPLYNLLVQKAPALIFLTAVMYLTFWLNRRLRLAGVPNRGDILGAVTFFALPLAIVAYICSGGIGFLD
jgi:hypothetical protein